MEEVVEPIEEEKPLWKRILVACLGVFLLFLLLGYFLFPLDTLAGLVGSATIEEGLSVEDAAVVFENDTYTLLLTRYYEHLDEEFKVCLLGFYDGTYRVQEIYNPIIYEQNFNSVVSEPCPKETLIALHSHPYKHCLASSQDIQNLQKIQETNPDALIGIMCDKDRFQFYA